MKRKKKIIDCGPYMVDYSIAGELREDTNTIVMDNTISRDNYKLKIKVILTSAKELYCGTNTVAIFKIHPKQIITSADPL